MARTVTLGLAASAGGTLGGAVAGTPIDGGFGRAAPAAPGGTAGGADTAPLPAAWPQGPHAQAMLAFNLQPSRWLHPTRWAALLPNGWRAPADDDAARHRHASRLVLRQLGAAAAPVTDWTRPEWPLAVLPQPAWARLLQRLGLVVAQPELRLTVHGAALRALVADIGEAELAWARQLAPERPPALPLPDELPPLPQLGPRLARLGADALAHATAAAPAPMRQRLALRAPPPGRLRPRRRCHARRLVAAADAARRAGAAMAFVLPRQPLSDPLRPQRLGLRLAPGTRIVRREDWLLWRAAEDALQAAQEQAGRIVVDARTAYEAERQRGHAEGREQAQLEQAERMIEQVGRTVDWFGRVEQRMVELVLQAVQRVMADFDDRTRVLAVVKGALAVVRHQKALTLRVAPGQLAAVQAAQNELLAAFPGVGYLEVVPDPRLAADACILESEIGVVEASIEGQLQALRRAFTTVLGSRA